MDRNKPTIFHVADLDGKPFQQYVTGYAHGWTRALGYRPHKHAMVWVEPDWAHKADWTVCAFLEELGVDFVKCKDPRRHEDMFTALDAAWRVAVTLKTVMTAEGFKLTCIEAHDFATMPKPADSHKYPVKHAAGVLPEGLAAGVKLITGQK
jgi:hypothetical protein